MSHTLPRFGPVSLTHVLTALILGLAVPTLAAQEAAAPQTTGNSNPEPYELVDKALVAFNHFMVDPDMTWFRNNLRRAKGIVIFPELIKAGFVFGGAGGRGVLLARDPETGLWSEPVFYAMGSLTWGLQIGGQLSEVVMMAMSEKGLEALYTSTVKLGAAASVAAGPVGAAAEGATAINLSADLLSFARSKGAFAGLTLEGAVVKVSDTWNQAYYGSPVRPVQIVVQHEVSNPHSTSLRSAVTQAAR